MASSWKLHVPPADRRAVDGLTAADLGDCLGLFRLEPTGGAVKVIVHRERGSDLAVEVYLTAAQVRVMGQVLRRAVQDAVAVASSTEGGQP